MNKQLGHGKITLFHKKKPCAWIHIHQACSRVQAYAYNQQKTKKKPQQNRNKNRPNLYLGINLFA